jgi:hypothetical protein
MFCPDFTTLNNRLVVAIATGNVMTLSFDLNQLLKVGRDSLRGGDVSVAADVAIRSGSIPLQRLEGQTEPP